ncbi:uncharacterized protein LOC106647266 [Copidosoma floridanum]|uniref:uncharacterized protein LOC106647266 n=1 Tax=Copidosoma floridanum TaxID=29053 RepID=UPI0006C94947|nr:uncharacterized protein LOC106647266 [Copidosoma floridanum]
MPKSLAKNPKRRKSSKPGAQKKLTSPATRTRPGKKHPRTAKARKRMSKSKKKHSVVGSRKKSQVEVVSSEEVDGKSARESSQSLRLKRSREARRRAQEKIKMMFNSSDDPYDRPLYWWEKSHVKYAFSHSGVKTRLELLMGSNVVRLTDRKYMMRLVSKIREEHERKQETRIEDRKMRELVRTKDLVLKRFISIQEAPAEIRQYPLFQLYSHCDSIIEQHRAKDTSKKVKIPASLYRMLYPHPSSENFEEEEGHEDVPLKEVLIDGQPVMVPMTKEEIEQQRTQQEAANDIKNGYMFTKEEYESLNYEADSVKKLKEVKTVNEMYKKAHDIVGFLISFSPKEKRKTCAMDADPASASSSAVVSAASASGASVKSRH